MLDSHAAPSTVTTLHAAKNAHSPACLLHCWGSSSPVVFSLRAPWKRGFLINAVENICFWFVLMLAPTHYSVNTKFLTLSSLTLKIERVHIYMCATSDFIADYTDKITLLDGFFRFWYKFPHLRPGLRLIEMSWWFFDTILLPGAEKIKMIKPRSKPVWRLFVLIIYH